MLSTAQADPTPWLPLPDLDDWVDGEPAAGTERANNYYRARYYDPKIGRFISEDPLPLSERTVQELNAYAYVANNPVNYVDPTGLVGLPPGYWWGWWDFFKWGRRKTLPVRIPFMIDCTIEFQECLNRSDASCCQRFGGGGRAQMGIFVQTEETCKQFGAGDCLDEYFKCRLPFF